MLNNQEAERALTTFQAWATTDYPDPYHADEVVQTAALFACQGVNVPLAYACARQIVYNYERRATKEQSLDEYIEAYGDALRHQPLPTPSIKPDTNRKAIRRAGGNATPRQPERGIEELGLEDETLFPTVLKNDYQRGILPAVGDLAIDIELQPKRHATLLRLILSSVTKGELKERGYKTSEIIGATQFLTDYYATPPSR